VIAQLGLALLVGLGANAILRGRKSWIAWPGALLAALLLLRGFAPLPELPLHRAAVGDRVPPAYRWLATHGQGLPLLELPEQGYRDSAERMYMSTFHWLPIIDGYSGYMSRSPVYLHRLAAGLPSEASLARLTSAVDVGWILVHRDKLQDRGAAWQGVLPPGLERVAEFGEDLLLRVTAFSPAGPTDRLFDTEKTLAGTPLAPLGASCPGSIRLVEPTRRIWESGITQNIILEVRNDGSAPWPGLGLVPRHLVHVMACMSLRDSEPCASPVQILLTDVPPQEAVRVKAMVATPPYAGQYDLHIALLQVGDGPLERCGVAPLVEQVLVASRPKGAPLGSYWMSCASCRFDGTTLSCRCLDRDGNHRETSTSARCPSGYANRDGALECEGSPAS
jgi:hypothetical protein